MNCTFGDELGVFCQLFLKIEAYSLLIRQAFIVYWWLESMEKLKDTIFKFLRLDGLVGHLSGYMEARIELLKIEIREDVAKTLANAMIFGVVFFFGFMFMIFFSIGLAHFLNQYFNESFIGYWIVAGLYLVGFLIFLTFKKSILKNFEKHLAEKIKHKEK